MYVQVVLVTLVILQTSFSLLKDLCSNNSFTKKEKNYDHCKHWSHEKYFEASRNFQICFAIKKH